MHKVVKWASETYRIGLMTNIMQGQLKSLKAKGLIPDVAYEAIVDSSVEGVLKPDPAAYTLAAQAAGCPPEQILLIDDTPANVKAAEAAGWHVMLFDTYTPEDSAAHVRDVLEPAS
jgi:putative hydrolase of the HAD superfamily